MNKVYRSVWNTTTNTWAAAAETAKSRSKGSARVARTAVAALVLGGASMTGAFAAEVDAAEEDEKTSQTVTVRQAPSTSSIGTQSIGTSAIGTTAALDDAYIKVNNGTGANAVAATATNAGSIAIGGNATADAGGATNPNGGGVAIGQGSTANRSSVAIGAGASAQGPASQATGAAFGTGSTANGAGATALGASSNATGSHVLAVGALAQVAADNGSALGYGASVTATGTNSVALGQASVADRANTVSVGNATTNSQRQIVNVAAGTQNTDAVNLGQMNTALSTKVDDSYFKANGNTGNAPASAVGSASVGIGSAAAVGASYGVAIGSNAQAGTSSAGAQQFATALGTDTVASALRSTAVGATATASGNYALASGSFASASGNNSVAIGGSMNALSQTRASGLNSVAVGSAAAATANNSVALGYNSIADTANTVSVGNTGAGGQRKIVNMAAGTAGTDAVNVSQLTPVVTALGGGAAIDPTTGVVTGPTYTLANGGTQTTIGGALAGLDGSLTTANTNITTLQQQIGNGTVGLVQQAAAGSNLTVGKDTDGAAVDFTNNASQQRKLIGVAAGTVSSTSREAINGSQLYGVSSSVASAIGAGSTVNADGSITAPSFTVGDGSGGTTIVRNVGAAVTNLNDRVTTNEGDITTLQQQVGSGTIGLVQQAGAGGNLTVGKSTDGAAVDFTNNASQQRKLIGVAAGTVSTTSREAINGSQLRGVSDSVASAIGAGSTVNADGSITAPSFTVGDGSGGTTIVHNVGAAVTNLNDRVTTNEGDITSIRNDLGSGSIGLVQQAGATADLTVGKNTGGAAVDFTGTNGARVLAGVANGTKDSDGVNYGQLRSAVGTIDDRLVSAVMYDTDKPDLSRITLAGTNGTLITNLSNGNIAYGSRDAVNGGQLFDMQTRIDQRFGDLSGRVDNLEAGGGSGGGAGGGSGSDYIGAGKGDNSLVVGAGTDASGSNSSAIGQGSSASGSNGTAVGQGSSASGSGGTAIGQGSSASGSGSTAIGQGSSATHNNSVALGAGSTTDREGSVSIGSEGAERQLTNLKAGSAPTDAVNVQQLNNTVHSARQDAMGGVAAAMAVAGLPQSTLPGRTFMAISGSTYGNEYGTAIGASYMTKDGKWVVKGAVNTSSRGEVGAVVGGGFYW